MVETFLSKLQLLLRGTASASPDKFGETLADEQQRGGSFLSAATSRAGSRTGMSGGAGPVHGQGQGQEGGGGATALPNAHMRLFGGAQYHRTMAEFRLAVGQVQCPEVSEERVEEGERYTDGRGETQGQQENGMSSGGRVRVACY